MNKKNKKINRKGFLFRFPRIASIVFIAFISIFALDIFWNGYSFWQTVLGLFIHLIPSRILLIVLLLSWKKYPLVGAIAFTIFGLRYTITNVVNFFMATEAGSIPAYFYLVWLLIIAIPAFMVGIYFFVDRRRNRENTSL